MKLKDLLEEKLSIKSDTYSNKITIVYLNPTKEELLELHKSITRGNALGEIRFIAHMPSSDRHYLYIWDSNDALHYEVARKFGTELSPYQEGEKTVQYGYGEINYRGHLTLHHIRNHGDWAWINEYDTGTN
jgi:hypothetical protein